MSKNSSKFQGKQLSSEQDAVYVAEHRAGDANMQLEVSLRRFTRSTPGVRRWQAFAWLWAASLYLRLSDTFAG